MKKKLDEKLNKALLDFYREAYRVHTRLFYWYRLGCKPSVFDKRHREVEEILTQLAKDLGLGDRTKLV